MIEELCRDQAEAAVQVLTAIITDPDASYRDRLAAAREILDRGYGKPVDRSVAIQLGNQAGSVDEYQISTRDLRRIAAGALAKLEAGNRGGQVIDLRPVSAPDSD